MSPTVPSPQGPLARYLSDPGAATASVLHDLTQVASGLAPYLAPAVAGVVVLTTLAAGMRRAATARGLSRGARLVRILPPPEVEMAGTEALWANLVALLRPAWRRVIFGQPHLSFELVASRAGVVIGIWVPGPVPSGLVERAVEAAWPGARTETGPPLPPLPLRARGTGGRLSLGRPEWFPLRIDHPADPYREVLGAMAGLGPDEVTCVQALLRPLTGRRLQRLRKAAATRRAGRPTGARAKAFDLVTPGTGRRPVESDPERSGEVTAILEKASQPAWALDLRYAVGTTDTDARTEGRLRGRAHSLASAFALYSGRNYLRRHRLRHPSLVLAARRMGRGDLVSVPELAALAHLPTDPAVPGLARAGAKAVPPPPQVGALGKVLGDSEGTRPRPVALCVPDARHHLHVLGATGSGKSTLLTNLVLGDVEAGRGVVVIDPKGDLVTDILERLPASAVGHSVLIDPDDDAAPPAMNVLEGPDPHLVVDNLVGIFRSIFESYWGPRTDDVLRSACLTLLHHHTRGGPVPTLTDVPRLLADEAFRARATAGIADPAGLGGFWSWYESMGDAARAQVVGPLLNKLRAFLLRDFVRKVVGRSSSSFSMGSDVLDGGLCLVRVPKGILGTDSARLLGSFVVARVWLEVTHRARLGQVARSDAALYVDECQNFMTLPRSFDEMLAEARGYRLSLVLAHQHLGQLGRDLREAISANARSKVFFSVSPEDGRALERHVAPELSAHDLSHLPAYTAAARLVVEGADTPTFTLRTRPPRPVVPGRAQEVRRAAKAAFGPKGVDQRRPALSGRRAPEPVGQDPGVRGRLGSGLASGIGSELGLSSEPLSGANTAGRGTKGPSPRRADSRGDRR